MQRNGVLIHLCAVLLYDAFEEKGFLIKPWLESDERSRSCGAEGLDIILPFETTIGFLATSYTGRLGLFEVQMERNGALMSDYYGHKKISLLHNRLLRTEEDYFVGPILSFCCFARDRLGEYQNQLTNDCVNFYLCLLYGTSVPKDVIRLLVRYYYRQLRGQVIEELNKLKGIRRIN